MEYVITFSVLFLPVVKFSESTNLQSRNPHCSAGQAVRINKHHMNRVTLEFSQEKQSLGWKEGQIRFTVLKLIWA